MPEGAANGSGIRSRCSIRYPVVVAEGCDHWPLIRLTLLEQYWNSPSWFILYFALAVYLGYGFFVKFDPEYSQGNSGEHRVSAVLPVQAQGID